jgi:putative phosphoribosyl transferase
MFTDREEAGRRLAPRLEHLRGEDVVVLGLPRGGVPVAARVAEKLGAPLDVIVVRKLGVPFQRELAMGAIGEGGVRVLNDEIVQLAGVSDWELREVEQRERAELERRARVFRGDRPRLSLDGRTAVIVDDGIATGSTAMAACRVARAQGARRIVLAVPVAPPDWTDRIGADADELVCIETPEPFFAIGQWYADFSQTSDEEVTRCLEQRTHPASPAVVAGGAPPAAADPPVRDEDVVVEAGGVRVHGHLTVPVDAPEVVVFAHGSGSSRHSARNRFVAGVLHEAGLGTLLFDLLTAEEELDRANVFDVELLGTRLVEVTRWLHEQPKLGGMPVAYFGASTGAAAALWAAAEPGNEVTAVVSRGGRPDLTGPRITDVAAPTLLVVGGQDEVVLELNREARARLRCPSGLAVVEGATHLFEEPGTLHRAAVLARDWFVDHLRPVPHPARASSASTGRRRS